MLKLWRHNIWCASLVVLLCVSIGAQTLDPKKDCSEKSKKLLQQAWVAQPMNVPENNVDPAKAESLYKLAIEDSPKCRPAMRLLVGLLLRSEKYQQANDYNELFLTQYPDDPSGLSERADLVSILKKDYPLALEIEMKLLDLPDFNKNGNVFYRVARTYSLMNKLDDSLSYLKLALSIDKDWVDKANAQTCWGFENLRKDARFWALVNKK
jgi:tetratricopeptide (TPR) repeat protein